MLRILLSDGRCMENREDREGARLHAFAYALARILWRAKRHSNRKNDPILLLITPIIRQERPHPFKDKDKHGRKVMYSTGGIEIGGGEDWIVLEPRTEQETIDAVHSHHKNIISGGVIPFTFSVSAFDPS